MPTTSAAAVLVPEPASVNALPSMVTLPTYRPEAMSIVSREQRPIPRLLCG